MLFVSSDKVLKNLWRNWFVNNMGVGQILKSFLRDIYSLWHLFWIQELLKNELSVHAFLFSIWTYSFTNQRSDGFDMKVDFFTSLKKGCWETSKEKEQKTESSKTQFWPTDEHHYQKIIRLLKRHEEVYLVIMGTYK